ncbi:BLUF domain-containing protein [Ferrigenium sp. UT5]|uniref:BLUF domain-containing protein n=1 Tax=Ferrigenium sp. UT5 TaxID=3242105 RepID=UPI00354CABFA
MLVRLIYISYSKNDVSEADLKQILEKSKINNKSKFVTGMLMYSDRYFFQCLEGERRDVNQTYLRISSDPRHSKCVLIDYSEISARLFPTWSMDYVAFNGNNNEMVLRYSENGLFQPYDFNAAQANAFLHEVAHTLANSNRAEDKPKSLLSWFKS